jgi:GT2 family glycosyltransferase
MITEGSAAPTLAVSVVTYRSDLERLAATLRCLAAALALARQRGVLAGSAVVLLDNDSGPAYGEALETLVAEVAEAFSPPISLLLLQENLGYGSGNNRALAERSSELVLILNPDIELQPEALAAALRVLAAQPAVVAVAPACSGATGHREYLCKRYPAVLDLMLRGAGLAGRDGRFSQRLARYEYRDRDPKLAAPVTLMSGACMLIRRDAFDAVGGFCPLFFMYFEDFDLSLRLAQRGTLHYEPTMRVVHHGGNAARKGLRHVRWFLSSALRFFSRHGWRWW